MRRFLSLPILLCVPVAGLMVEARAADHPSFTDLRLEVSMLDDTLESDSTASGPFGSVSSSGDIEFDDAWRVGIIAVSARASSDGVFAFGSGGGIQYSDWDDDAEVDQTLQVLAATLRLGVVIRPNEMFHIEAMPYGAVGAAQGEIEDEESDVALYWEFGAIAGAFLTFDSFQVGVHAGYLWNGTDLEFESDANFPVLVEDVEAELRGEGAFFGLSVGGRF